MKCNELIIYHIFLDRFAGFDENADDSKPIRIGGNLKAIEKKISYLKKLGINCIWLSPFYKSSDYHGYSVEDFYSVDPSVGSENDLKQLVKKAHDNGILVIADFVPNHCSEKHPFFLEALNDPKSKYKNWFYFKQWPFDYLCFLDFRHLPKLNLDNHEAKKHVIDAALHWLKIGIDGFRVDHAIGPSKEFIKDFVKTVKKQKKDAILLAEVWFQGVDDRHKETIRAVDLDEIMKSKNMEDAAVEQMNEFDCFLDFTFNNLVKKYFKGEITAEEFFRRINEHYKSEACFASFLDNHDMNRFIFEVNNNKNIVKIASVLQFFMNQPVIIYYGNEVGLSQAIDMNEIKEHGDVQARRAMLWNDVDEDMLDHYKRLCLLRKKLPVMSYGEIIPVYTDPSQRFMVLLKRHKDQKMMLVVNPDKNEVKFSMDFDSIGLDAKYAIDMFNDEKIEKSSRISVKPESFMVLFLK
ncbi:MAG: alpha-amylase family glycosyl hydrolase [Candidatus Aenigmatarchaeota archaeon]